jgi:hypothetical protein
MHRCREYGVVARKVPNFIAIAGVYTESQSCIDNGARPVSRRNGELHIAEEMGAQWVIKMVFCHFINYNGYH